jgi:hypothetical protein
MVPFQLKPPKDRVVSELNPISSTHPLLPLFLRPPRIGSDNHELEHILLRSVSWHSGRKSTAAPRAYWKGYLKLSLVTLSVAMYPALIGKNTLPSD